MKKFVFVYIYLFLSIGCFAQKADRIIPLFYKKGKAISNATAENLLKSINNEANEFIADSVWIEKKKGAYFLLIKAYNQITGIRATGFISLSKNRKKIGFKKESDKIKQPLRGGWCIHLDCDDYEPTGTTHISSTGKVIDLCASSKGQKCNKIIWSEGRLMRIVERFENLERKKNTPQ